MGRLAGRAVGEVAIADDETGLLPQPTQAMSAEAPDPDPARRRLLDDDHLVGSGGQREQQVQTGCYPGQTALWQFGTESCHERVPPSAVALSSRAQMAVQRACLDESRHRKLVQNWWPGGRRKLGTHRLGQP